MKNFKFYVRNIYKSRQLLKSNQHIHNNNYYIMKNFITPFAKKCLLSVGVALGFSLFVNAQGTASYTIRFDSTWSPTTHPAASFPGSAHWSDLVGATHNSSVTFVAAGQLASPGIENVAELGSNGVFNSEVNAAITAGTADQWIQQGFSPFAAISSASVTVTVSTDYPLISLASMIAPSPDWMIYVNSVSVLDGSGNWIPSISLTLYPQDAGTEEGNTYILGNPASSPHVPIFSRQNVAPFSNLPVGTMTITLNSVLSVDDQSLSNAINVFPNPSKGKVTIDNRGDIGLESAELYSVLGDQVASFDLTRQTEKPTLDLASLGSGIYFLQLRSSKGQQATRKIVIE